MIFLKSGTRQRTLNDAVERENTNRKPTPEVEFTLHRIYYQLSESEHVWRSISYEVSEQ